MATFVTTIRELSLREMLADPIVQTVMSRDGVIAVDIEHLFTTLRAKTPSRQREITPGNLPQAVPGRPTPEQRVRVTGRQT